MVLGTVTNLTKKSAKSTQKAVLKQTFSLTANTTTTTTNIASTASTDTDTTTNNTTDTDTTTNTTDSDDTEIEDDLFIHKQNQRSSYRITVDCKSSCNPKAISPVWDPTAIETHALLSEEFKNMPGIFDDDDEDTFDIAMAAEYSDDIFEYMRELEFKYKPDSGYIQNQSELDWNSRSILVDWLVRIHDYCNLLPETLFLTVHYIDRFLSLKAVGQAKLQLVGVVALFVAAKYEEITCPTVQEIAYMVDDEYSVDEILRAERYMIHLLEFNLGWPGPMSFLRRSSKADDYDGDTRTLAKYLLELTIMDIRFISCPPSFLAAAAHYLARQILLSSHYQQQQQHLPVWTKAHAYFSGYTESQLIPAVEIIKECCQNPTTHHKSVYKKYSHERFKWASLHVAEWISEA